MKVLIVDDEAHVREGVDLVINWSDYNIDERFMAENGKEALEIVRREAPELIICDMSMPVVDGPTFLKQLREEGWDSKVIVLSGYQEFRYTRATLLASGVDYLLKPFKRDDLDKAVAKAVQAILDSKQTVTEELRKNYQVHEANTLLNEQKMQSYLQGDSPNLDGVRHLLTEAGFPLHDFYIALFLPRNLPVIVDRYFMADEALFYFSIRNILRDVFKPLGGFYSFRLDSFFCVLVRGEATVEEINYYCAKLGESWQTTIKLRTLSGLSRKTHRYTDIWTGLHEARAEILKANLLGSNVKIAGQPHSPIFMDKEILILEALKRRDKESIAEFIHTFGDELREHGYLTLQELQHYTIEVNVMVMRISRQLDLVQYVEPLSLWISELDEWEKALTHVFWLMIESEGEHLSSLQSFSAIRHYIEAHIHEDITLTFLSDKFHFSPQYISKKFKETYNTTVINYLTHLRMEKAKSLLCHSDKSILEISQLVGYEDDNYFGKVFRKQVGESPTHYRRNHGMMNSIGN